MDNDPSRRQYVPSSYATQQPLQATGESPGQYAASGAVERFRQSYQPSSAPTSRAGPEQQPYYGFQQGTNYAAAPGMQHNPLYGQEMQLPEPQRQPTQQYSQYGGSLMYEMAQPQAPQTPSSSYDPHYRQRPNSASETLGTQFGVPQPAHYYLAAQGGPTSAPAADYSTQPLPTQYHQHESYAQPGHPTQQSYAGAMMEPAPSSSYPQFAQQQQQQQQYAPQQQQAQSSDQAFDAYQRSIRQLFTLAQEGSLRESEQYLLHISQYLLGNAENLRTCAQPHPSNANANRLYQNLRRTTPSSMTIVYGSGTSSTARG